MKINCEFIQEKEDNIVKVLGVTFAEDEPIGFVKTVVNEILEMQELSPGMLTARGLIKRLKCEDDYVLFKMLNMPIGSGFTYKDQYIKRCSENLFVSDSIGGECLAD